MISASLFVYFIAAVVMGVDIVVVIVVVVVVVEVVDVEVNPVGMDVNLSLIHI